MNMPLELRVKEKGLIAYVTIIEHPKEKFTSQQILDYLYQNGIQFGIKEHIINLIVEEKTAIQEEYEIAVGQEPIAGEDGYIHPEFHKKSRQVDQRSLNYRDILAIPNVVVGELLATYIPPTNGTDGKDVFNKIILAKSGKRLPVKPGKNTVVKNNKYYATIDGQLSINRTSVSVHPVFEVRGDLDLKTGNIDFIGNVIVNGNVPPGYTINAGGDIQIHGIVEGSDLSSGGSIFIQGGVIGSRHGRIEAKNEVHVSYLNQTEVICGGDLYIERSSINSNCHVNGKIITPRGHIYGGTCAAIKGIEVGSVGNDSLVKTSLFLGTDKSLVEREAEIQKRIYDIRDTLNKLKFIVEKLQERVQDRITSPLHEVELLKKQQATYNSLVKEQSDLKFELEDINESLELANKASLVCHNSLYPNVQVQFGKYIQTFKYKYQNARVSLVNYEIKVMQ